MAAICLAAGCKFPSGAASEGVLLALLLYNAAYTTDAPLPDTGQLLCYNGASATACGNATFPGQDGDYVSALTYTLSDGGATVTSNQSGLIWDRCLKGTAWNGSTCAGSATSDTYAVANTYCAASSVAGRVWRIPTIRELLTLPDYGMNPLIDTSLWPGYPGGTQRAWSQTANVPIGGQNWAVNFGVGNIQSIGVASAVSMIARCVSGTMPSVSFSDQGNGMVYDAVAGVYWTKCLLEAGGVVSTGTCGAAATQTWSNALITCNNLTLGGRRWRLPNIKEGAHFLKLTASATPFLESPFTASTGFSWSGTTQISTLANAMPYSDTDTSNPVLGSAKSTAYAARCVSDL